MGFFKKLFKQAIINQTKQQRAPSQRQSASSARKVITKHDVADGIKAQARERAQQLLKIVRDCAELVNTTSNPEVFFMRYNLMLEHLETLAGLECTGIFENSPELPSKAFLRVESQFTTETNIFLDRSFASAKEHADTLKTADEKKNAIQSYFNNMEKYIHHMDGESLEYFYKLKTEYEKQEVQQQETLAFHEEEYRKALRLYDEAQADKEYQKKLSQYYELITKIKETYSVINNLGSFSDAEGDKLIESCSDALGLEAELKEKMEYYENCVFDMSPVCKTLAMIYEKRGQYQMSASICAYAIENGYVSDGTAGGMRGRLSRMIKKGNLPLTENFKELLNL